MEVAFEFGTQSQVKYTLWEGVQAAVVQCSLLLHSSWLFTVEHSMPLQFFSSVKTGCEVSCYLLIEL